jgi:CheY-like chemotaxis protein
LRNQVLCVDDEPMVLEGLTLQLRRHYDVATAPSGAIALEMLASAPGTAVVISDMRMPGMDGATFLTRARHLVPEATRVLLTGQADLSSAVAAVNEGQIFRFLTKPCPPVTFLAAVAAAAEQHRLITSERVLLEQTLHGSIQALIDVLALTNPVAFGRATSLKKLVAQVVARLGLRDARQVEMAALLSQLACITLPAETVDKLYFGRALDEAELKMVERLPAVTEQLLGNIPRLEVVRGMLSGQGKPFRPADPARPDPERQLVDQGAAILRATVDFDALHAQGCTSSRALDLMRGRAGIYDPAVLDALGAQHAGRSEHEDVRELPLAALRIGMIIVDEVRMATGALLVGRGYEVTPGFLERVRNFRPGMVKAPVRVVVPDEDASATRRAGGKS